jgi:hypothetical protein
MSFYEQDIFYFRRALDFEIIKYFQDLSKILGTQPSKKKISECLSLTGLRKSMNGCDDIHDYYLEGADIDNFLENIILNVGLFKKKFSPRKILD